MIRATNSGLHISSPLYWGRSIIKPPQSSSITADPSNKATKIDRNYKRRSSPASLKLATLTIPLGDPFSPYLVLKINGKCSKLPQKCKIKKIEPFVTCYI